MKGIEPTPGIDPTPEKNQPVSENIREPSTPGTSAADLPGPGKAENAIRDSENRNPSNRRQTALEGELERIAAVWPVLTTAARKNVLDLLEALAAARKGGQA